MTGRYGTGGCFYSLFSSQKSSRAQIRAGISLRSRGRTWGNLPIEAGRSPRGRLPYPRKGEQGAGDAGPEGQMGMGRREARGRGTQHRIGALQKQVWRSAERALSVLPQAVPQKRRQRAGSRKRAWSACDTCRGQPGLAAQAAATVRSWATDGVPDGPCRARGRRKPPQGGGFRSEDGGRDTAAVITGCSVRWDFPDPGS